MRYFLSLAGTGSITKAAELHRISAAAFSKAMKIFEQEVGRPLTITQGRGVILTDFAKTLVPQVQAIVLQIDAVREGTARASANSPSLRVATFEVFSTHFMSRALGEFFPGFGCELHELTPGKMEAAVATGIADLGLTYIPIPHPELDFLRICEIDMSIYGQRHLIHRASFDSVPFVVPVGPIEGSPNKVRGLDGWPDDAFPRAIKFRVQMLETALGLCRQGLAVAYIPRFIARLHNDLMLPKYRLDTLGLPRNFPKRQDAVYLIKRKSDHESGVAKKLAKAVRMLTSRT